MRSAILSLAGLSLLRLSMAQPFNRHNAHRALHNKRDTVIETVYVEDEETPEVIIYVGADGVPFSSTTEFLDGTPVTSSALSTIIGAGATSSAAITSTTSIASVAAVIVPTAASVASSSESIATTTPVVVPTTQAAIPVASSSSSIAVVAPVISSSVATSSTPIVTSTPVVTPTSSSVAVTVASSSTVSSAQASSTAAASSSGGMGFAFSPYNADGSCMTQDQVNMNFAVVPTSTYSTVRIYGVDCNQVSTVMVAAKKYGFSIMAGVYDFTAVSTETQSIIDAANGDWSQFSVLSCGNEWMNSGVTDSAGVLGAVATMKSMVTAAGYTGKIVAVDTLSAAKLYPEVCNSGDVDACYLNCHPFFDVNTDAASAGTFITTQISEMQALLTNSDMDIVITETGWPSAGDPNGLAVPSSADQTTALAAIKTAFSSNPAGVVLFSTFNTMWKVNSAALFMAERSWGFLGTDGYQPSDIELGLIASL